MNDQKVVAWRSWSKPDDGFTEWVEGRWYPFPDDAIQAHERLGHRIELAYSESHVRALEEQCRGLADALEKVLPFVVTEVLEHCDGNKCRESWCAGCMGEEEAESIVQKSREARSDASQALAHYRSGK